MRDRSLLAGALVFLAAAAPPPQSHEDEVLAWRQGRLERLQAPDGWLSLAGLHWLEPGPNTYGSAQDNDIVLPSGPPRAGTLVVGDDGVRLEPAAGVEHLVGGEPAGARPLASDREGQPTIVTVGALSFQVIDREGHLLLRVKDPESPARRDFGGLEYYPIDPAWRLPARFEVHDPPKELPLADVTGLVQRTPSWGAVVFEIDGETYRLDAAAEPGDEELFLIFGDRTNGRETYGAGRYLYVPAPDEAGRIDLDFNRAYNPPCAFTAYATCPLPPPQNRLPLRIEAGEKKYSGAH